MLLKSSYVLKIPDLHRMLHQEDMVHWEIFFRHSSKQYEKINWRSTCLEEQKMQQVLEFSGILKAVKIDFQNSRIVFCEGAAEQGKFEEFLLNMLDNVFVRVDQDRMHFIVSPKNRSKKEFSIMT